MVSSHPSRVWGGSPREQAAPAAAGAEAGVPGRASITPSSLPTLGDFLRAGPGGKARLSRAASRPAVAGRAPRGPDRTALAEGSDSLIHVTKWRKPRQCWVSGRLNPWLDASLLPFAELRRRQLRALQGFTSAMAREHRRRWFRLLGDADERPS
jgi:hypothetical protein